MLLVKPSGISAFVELRDELAKLGFDLGFDVELTKQQFEELAPHSREQVARYIYTDVASGNYILCSDDAKYMNHSDTPNTCTEGHQTVATCQIEPGQEITCNYYEFDGGTRKTTVQE